jgi:hypothetical protein
MQSWRGFSEVSVGLTNDAKDVVGLLRGINLIVVLWTSDHLSFPLDNDFKRALVSCRNNLESLLGVVCRICQMQGEVEELRLAIDDLVPNAEPTYYTEENLTSLLSLFSGVETSRSFSFGRGLEFHRQTKPILLSLFSRLVKAMLWVRVACFDMNPGSSLPDLCADLTLACSLLRKLCPSDVEMPPSRDMLSRVISDWRSSPDVEQGLQLTKNEPSNGLYRIVEELKACM